MLNNENKNFGAMCRNIISREMVLSAYHVSLQNVAAFHVLQTIFTDIELRKPATNLINQ